MLVFTEKLNILDVALNDKPCPVVIPLNSNIGDN
jgi:hypothetical protein